MFLLERTFPKFSPHIFSTSTYYCVHFLCMRYNITHTWVQTLNNKPSPLPLPHQTLLLSPCIPLNSVLVFLQRMHSSYVTSGDDLELCKWCKRENPLYSVAHSPTIWIWVALWLSCLARRCGSPVHLFWLAENKEVEEKQNSSRFYFHLFIFWVWVCLFFSLPWSVFNCARLWWSWRRKCNNLEIWWPSSRQIMTVCIRNKQMCQVLLLLGCLLLHSHLTLVIILWLIGLFLFPETGSVQGFEFWGVGGGSANLMWFHHLSSAEQALFFFFDHLD